jgi:hypothetical protein
MISCPDMYITVCSAVKYSVEQKVFIYQTLAQHSSWGSVRKFHGRYPDNAVPCKITIYSIITNV